MNILFKTSKLSVAIIIVIAGLVVINFLAGQWFKRWDLTANSIYSLSQVSQQTVAELPEELNIEVVFGPELPSQYINLQQTVNDILAEYASYSSKIKITAVTPEEIENKAQELRLPQVQFNTVRKDKLEVLNGYLGLALHYQEQTETIPVIQDTSNLEYQITSLIKKISSPVTPIIGVVQSHGALNLDQDISTAYNELKKLYQVRRVDLSSEEAIANDIQTLIIPAPQTLIEPAELQKIDDWLLSGKSALILAEANSMAGNLAWHQSANNLSDWLADYGLILNQDFVLDKVNAMAPFNQGFITFNVNYPFWPKITNANFNQTVPAVAKLEGVVLPWTTSLEIDQSIAEQAQILAHSSEQAWVKSGEYTLLPNQELYNNEELKSYNFIIKVQSLTNLPSEKNNSDSQLIVVADSDFITDSIVQRYPANLMLWQNLIDNLSLDSDLATIRAKEITERPIKELTTAQRRWLRYGNVFGLTIIIIALGLLRYYWRRKFNNFSL